MVNLFFHRKKWFYFPGRSTYAARSKSSPKSCANKKDLSRKNRMEDCKFLFFEVCLGQMERFVPPRRPETTVGEPMNGGSILTAARLTNSLACIEALAVMSSPRTCFRIPQ